MNKNLKKGFEIYETNLCCGIISPTTTFRTPRVIGTTFTVLPYLKRRIEVIQ